MSMKDVSNFLKSPPDLSWILNGKKITQKAADLRNKLGLESKPSQEELINTESKLGGTIFGPIPEGRRREFFHFKDNIWLWYESWTDQAGYHEFTIRYEVRESGVFKKIRPGKYQKLTGDELENFYKAAKTYLKVIKEHLYKTSD